MHTRAVRRLLTCLLMLASTGFAHAHDLGLARITLTTLGPDSIRLDAKLPAKLQPTRPSVTAPCDADMLGELVHDRLSKTVSWRIDCLPGAETDAVQVTLDWQREGALLVTDDGSGQRREHLLDADDGVIRLDLAQLLQNNESMLVSAQRYLVLGVEHILAGIDHLAFVLGICLIASGWRLVKLITAFTIGHSLTLVAASLGWFQLPVAPTEAVIALSVAFIAREALLDASERRHGFMLVALFGLLHGLGFASAVGELGLSRESLLPALLAFNIGVEIGQLLFVGFVVTTATLTRRAGLIEARQVRAPLAMILGTVAMVWTFERISGFL
ncbi:MAG: HupE/UreJ family protein [Gammaproteobacteria bacterium]|nr:HupE/UreJ family protein [Gammaproteobacteria bacterium]